MFPGTGEPPTSTISQSLPQLSIVSGEENKSAKKFNKRTIIIIIIVVVVIVVVAVIIGVIVYLKTKNSDTSSDEPSSDEPSSDEPSSDEPSSDEPSSDEPSSDEPSSDEPSSDEPSSDQPSSGDPSFGGPYRREAVATDTPQCSQIGKKILNANGSAVDAAIAAMFCLGVVSMQSSGIGGGGIMLMYSRSLQEASVIDFRETAPAAAHRDMFEGTENHGKAKKGGLSIAVPGEVRGLYDAWKQHGRLPWKKLVQPAIDLARNGFNITKSVNEALRAKDIKEDILDDPGLRELLLDENGTVLYKEGDIIKNEKYAKTLEQVQIHPESFYSGKLAIDIARDIERANGTVTADDLRNYKSIIRKPYKGELSGMTMYVTPPPTSGAVLALILNILKGYNLTSPFSNDVNSSVLTYHRIIEAFKFSYAWRSRLGDPKFDSEINKVAKAMLNQTLADRLRHKIWDNMTHDNVSYYTESFSDTDYGTTHVAVLAPNGDAVSVTSTINMRFGSRYRSNVTGIIYNNEMADFDIPGHNIVDGISPSRFNFPAPNKRPFSSISPAILTNDDGTVQLVIGASGGKIITTAVSLVLMNKLWFEQSLQQAVNKPRLHTQLVPDQNVSYETDETYAISPKIRKGLRKLGHVVTGEKRFAVVQAVFRDPKTKKIFAKSDPRKYGEPAGQ